MKLSLGFSPCPNDTFMFDALINNKIDTEGLDFYIIFEDVESLYMMGINADLDITKLSYHAFTYCFKEYITLNSGSAIGRNCGPILIKKKDSVFKIDTSIAIPGKYTTANMLMEFFYPDYQNKEEIIFSDIEEEVSKNNIGAGLIIHESRFTYQEKGLVKISDLGELWEEETALPIPLGGIFVRRSLPYSIQKRIDRVIKRSIKYALKNRDESFPFIRSHAQEIGEGVIKNHIDLYVNDFSLSLGSEGRSAIKHIFNLKSINSPNLFLTH